MTMQPPQANVCRMHATTLHSIQQLAAGFHFLTEYRDSADPAALENARMHLTDVAHMIGSVAGELRDLALAQRTSTLSNVDTRKLDNVVPLTRKPS